MDPEQTSLDESLNYKHKPGSHTRLSPVVGSRVNELDMVSSTVKGSPALQNYEKELYRPERVYLIPKEQRDQADVVAKGLFSDYVEKYKGAGVTADNAVAVDASGAPGAATNMAFVYDTQNQWNTWRVQAVAEANNGKYNERGNGYLPPDVVKYHELMHVEETKVGISEKDSKKILGSEIMTATKTLMLEDQIYKKINDLPLDSVVDYGQTLKLGNKDVPLGSVANFYRRLEQRHGNLAKAITSPESLKFLESGQTNDADLKGTRRNFSKARYQDIQPQIDESSHKPVEAAGPDLTKTEPQDSGLNRGSTRTNLGRAFRSLPMSPSH